jgi:hypothetical protein
MKKTLWRIWAKITKLWGGSAARILELEMSNAQLERDLKSANDQISTSMTATINANRAATDARFKMDEALEREARAQRDLAMALKSVANYAVMASGSRLPIFDDAGPTRPQPQADPRVDVANAIHGKRHARDVVNQFNRDFVTDYFKEPSNQ